MKLHHDCIKDKFSLVQDLPKWLEYVALLSFTPGGHSRPRLLEFLIVLFPFSYYWISGVF